MATLRDLPPMELAELSAAPFQFTASTTLDAEPHAVFTELGDPSLWFPLMRRSVWRTGATSGVGALREVDIRGFGRFRERMLAWDPGARVAFTMIATSSPMVARMVEDWALAHSDGGTHVTWSIGATPTAMGRVAQPALRAILHGMFRRGCANLGRRAGAYPRHRGTQAS